MGEGGRAPRESVGAGLGGAPEALRQRLCVPVAVAVALALEKAVAVGEGWARGRAEVVGKGEEEGQGEGLPLVLVVTVRSELAVREGGVLAEGVEVTDCEGEGVGVPLAHALPVAPPPASDGVALPVEESEALTQALRVALREGVPVTLWVP